MTVKLGWRRKIDARGPDSHRSRGDGFESRYRFRPLRSARRDQGQRLRFGALTAMLHGEVPQYLAGCRRAGQAGRKIRSSTARIGGLGDAASLKAGSCSERLTSRSTASRCRSMTRPSSFVHCAFSHIARSSQSVSFCSTQGAPDSEQSKLTRPGHRSAYRVPRRILPASSAFGLKFCVAPLRRGGDAEICSPLENDKARGPFAALGSEVNGA